MTPPDNEGRIRTFDPFREPGYEPGENDQASLPRFMLPEGFEPSISRLQVEVSEIFTTEMVC